jgi:hypothetical protein
VLILQLDIWLLLLLLHRTQRKACGGFGVVAEFEEAA